MTARLRDSVGTWSISVEGYGSARYVARTKSAATYAAYVDFSDTRQISFRDFLARIQVLRLPNEGDVGRPILVAGEPAIHCGERGGRVRFVYRDRKGAPLLAHPCEIRKV
ncbi:MAG: hypothetical protein QM651_07955 [Rhodoblastus sp.]